LDLHQVLDLEAAVAQQPDPLPVRQPELQRLLVDVEVVPGLVEVEVAVPRLRPAVR